MGWKHYPGSPFGDVDICFHGCTRKHGSKKKVCVYCDYPPEAKITLVLSEVCRSITYHLNGKCMRRHTRRR